jgi:hypothetical protein
MLETYFSASKMLGICAAGQADDTLTVSQPHLSGTAIAPARPCDTCGRQRTSAMSWPGKGQGAVRNVVGIGVTQAPRI